MNRSSCCYSDNLIALMDLANAFGPSVQAYPFDKNSEALELEHGTVADFLKIDDLLDFSEEDIGGPIGDFCNSTYSSISCQRTEDYSCNSSLPSEKSRSSEPIDIFEADATNLYVPSDDLAELEWLSNFVEESFYSGNIAATNLLDSSVPLTPSEDQNKDDGSTKHAFQSTSPVSVLGKMSQVRTDVVVGSVRGRARSKRNRTGVCFWNSRVLSGESRSSNVVQESWAKSVIMQESCGDASSKEQSMRAPTTKKMKKMKEKDEKSWRLQARLISKSLHEQHTDMVAAASSSSSSSSTSSTHQDMMRNDDMAPRRCLHCAAQKTPQWRAGPLGPKTLCNACGVRFKSGRLLPEYRPAASPTFVDLLHSNSHRRVLEMHRQNMSHQRAPQQPHHLHLQHQHHQQQKKQLSSSQQQQQQLPQPQSQLPSVQQQHLQPPLLQPTTAISTTLDHLPPQPQLLYSLPDESLPSTAYSTSFDSILPCPFRC